MRKCYFVPLIFVAFRNINIDVGLFFIDISKTLELNKVLEDLDNKQKFPNIIFYFVKRISLNFWINPFGDKPLHTIRATLS